jgi:hypothetical protein
VKNKKIRFREIRLCKKEIELLIEGMIEDIEFLDEIEREEGNLDAEDKSKRKMLKEMIIQFKEAGLEWKESSKGIFEVTIDGQQIVRMRMRD